MNTLDQIAKELQRGKRKNVRRLCQKALDEGYAASEILQNGLLNGMYQLGDLFRENTVFVPHVLIASQAMKSGLEILMPMLQNGAAITGETVCIGTVRGDVHDIGKTLVSITLEGEGFRVIDLGVDVPAEEFVETVKKEGCKIVILSALLTTTMSFMKEVIRAFEKARIRDQVFIMVGGAPVTKEFAESIGADAYTEDCFEAARIARKHILELKER